MLNCKKKAKLIFIIIYDMIQQILDKISFYNSPNSSKAPNLEKREQEPEEKELPSRRDFIGLLIKSSLAGVVGYAASNISLTAAIERANTYINPEKALSDYLFFEKHVPEAIQDVIQNTFIDKLRNDAINEFKEAAPELSVENPTATTICESIRTAVHEYKESGNSITVNYSADGSPI